MYSNINLYTYLHTDSYVSSGMPTQVTYRSRTLSGVQLKRRHDVDNKYYQTDSIINTQMLSNIFKNEDPLLGTHSSFVY